MISSPRIILSLSILANVGFIITGLVMTLKAHIGDHYYRDFTGMIINNTHIQISKGNIQPTLKILEEIPPLPEYEDLTKALKKFSDMNDIQNPK